MEKIIIHGGVSITADKDSLDYKKNDALVQIAKKSFYTLRDYNSKKSVLNAVQMLEDNPLFNAGTGSKIQSDKQVRMSAALMDGNNNNFSGVVNVQNIKNPIQAAAILSKEEFSILSGDQATDFCRKKGLEKYNPITSERLDEFKKMCSGKHGTVGAVAIDSEGMVFSGTSTGGVGFETPGRVSDSPTVAGTYASKKAGVSCTGIGEQIIRQAVAAKIVTRVDDGMKLYKAVEKTILEANKLNYLFGLISLDYKGNYKIGKTAGINKVYYAFFDGKEIKSFLD
tara:strand:+ start:68 stop:916 length:849 start_codon:yes stop_codon:yes gene_type:complete